MENTIDPNLTRDIANALQLLIKKSSAGENVELGDFQRFLQHIVRAVDEAQHSSTPRVDPWHSGENYLIGDPSPYVTSIAAKFLEEGVKRLIPDIVPAVLMDFGCWSGRHTSALMGVKEKHRIFGIDAENATPRVDQARMLYETTSQANRVSFHARGLMDTGIAEGSVHGLLCWRVLHNLTRLGELTRALRELSRVMVSGGRIVLAVRALKRGYESQIEKLADEWDERHKRDSEESPLGDSARTPIHAPLKLDIDELDSDESPQLVRTFHSHGEREDYNFSPGALIRLLSIHRIKTQQLSWLMEGEMVDGKLESNLYLVAHAVRQ